MDKLSLLKKISFGARVAEEETGDLSSYFVETDQWERINRGEVDIVRGDKGSGKSAIYSLLIARTDSLFDRHILLAPAEKPRGATVFRDLEVEPPASEIEFVNLWKLYILSLVGQKLREFGIAKQTSRPVLEALETAGLLESEFDLSSLLRVARNYVRRMLKVEAVEGGMTIDPTTGMPSGVTGKITFREPTKSLEMSGFVSVDTLFRISSKALKEDGYQVWILLDRLDVAFADNSELEKNALRALFRVYLDFLEFPEIRLKIFLRSDIWNRISEEGFRESSHITRYIVLEWDHAALHNLIMRRILNNPSLLAEYSIDKNSVLGDFQSQKELFGRMFPAQVEQGSRKPNTFDWMVSRCADASDKTAPRELIHLLGSLREKEIERLERGEEPPPDGRLFDRSVFKQALPAVSEARLVQNLYAEYPENRPFLDQMNGEKTEQTIESLTKIWSLDRAAAMERANRLAAIGFFQVRGTKDEPTFWVPFLYRDFLNLSQGLADDS